MYNNTHIIYVQIPGNYRDAMNPKSRLGAAIRDACEELNTLGGLEQGVLQEAEDLLKQVGFKGSLFQTNTSADADDESDSSSE